MPPCSPAWKVMVSAPVVALASRMAWRRLPAPDSFTFRTVRVAGARRSSRASRLGRRARAGRRGLLGHALRANRLRAQERGVMGTLLAQAACAAGNVG